MSEIAKIDRNVAMGPGPDLRGIRFTSVLDAPLSLHGLISAFPLRRIPEAVAAKASDSVASLNQSAAGGRVRFVTDSSRVVLRARMHPKFTFPHMTFLGTSCFDAYIRDGGKYRYCGNFMCDPGGPELFEREIRFECAMEREIMIDLPLYDGVDEMYVGIEDNARLLPAPGYSLPVPVVYYGSSITQGGCASRPGMAYEAIISRRFDCDYINLGWAGSALGEAAVARYIAGLEMSVFVLDYDHNAPDAAHLAATHEEFFLTVRRSNPDLPVIMITKPDVPHGTVTREVLNERRDVIRRTYGNAVAAGDRNVYFIDGAQIYSRAAIIGAEVDDCTVDCTHPNDLGFACMAAEIGDAIARATGWTQ